MHVLDTVGRETKTYLFVFTFKWFILFGVMRHRLGRD